ncbi:MAG: single-stranded DNA-binding protein [Sphingobacteriales bacterium]|nr:MAG: single-stranded DNA-binding protein [Sphingobacteriales bacterium]
MSSVNKVILIGRLGKDPEIRYTNDSTPVANFSIATSEYYKDKNGERQESTEWHNIVAWRQLAEISEKFLHKGKLVFIEGKLRTRSWEDKDGNKKYATEVVADNITMLGRKEDDEQGGNQGGGNYGNSNGKSNTGGSYQDNSRPQGAASTGKAADMQIDDDDLPF